MKYFDERRDSLAQSAKRPAHEGTCRKALKTDFLSRACRPKYLVGVGMSLRDLRTMGLHDEAVKGFSEHRELKSCQLDNAETKAVLASSLLDKKKKISQSTNTHARVQIYIYIYVCVCIKHIYIYKYVYVNIYTNIHTHTCSYVRPHNSDKPGEVIGASRRENRTRGSRLSTPNLLKRTQSSQATNMT